MGEVGAWVEVCDVFASGAGDVGDCIFCACACQIRVSM